MDKNNLYNVPSVPRFSRALYVILFSLNAGFATTFAVLVANAGKALRPQAFQFLVPAGVLLVHYAEASNRVLHLWYRSDAGFEIAAGALIVIIALPIFLIASLVARSTLGRMALSLTGGLSALALVPAFYLYARESTWWDFGVPLYPFWRSPEPWVFTLEMPVICAFFLLARNWRYRVAVGAAVLALHYSVWTGLLWWTFGRIPLLGPKLFYFVFPCSGFAWLFYSRSLAPPQHGRASANRKEPGVRETRSFPT